MYHPEDWGKAQPAWDYIWRCVGRSPRIPYGWWLSGEVPAEDPAWGDNSPPPDPANIDTCFCAGLGNLMIRALKMFGEGYVIPNLGNTYYDGGTVGWKGYYEGYGTLDNFDLEFAKTHEGTVMLREYRDASSDQGHWAVTAYYDGDGQMYTLQTFPPDGLNWTYTVEQSHDGGYYEYMVKPWNWLPITEEEYYSDSSNGGGQTQGGSTLTAELLVSAMTSTSFEGPDLDPADAKSYLPHLIKACEDWEINTRARLSAFLAQVGTESGSFKWWREFSRGEGKPFGFWYGRGPMQLTWEGNYQNFQDATGYRAHDNAELVADDSKTGFQSAGWYWRNGNGDLNDLADLATWQAFYEITGRVWGQPGPFGERDARYSVAWNALPEDLMLSGSDEDGLPEPTPDSSLLLDPISARWGYYRYESDESWNLVKVPAPKEDTKEVA